MKLSSSNNACKVLNKWNLKIRTMAAATPQLILIPALFFGTIIGIIELMFVHADERGMGWLGHGLHAIPATIIFTVLSMNTHLFLAFIGQKIELTWYIAFGIRLLIAIIAMMKISAAAAIVGRVGEKFPHTLSIGALILAAPYAWDLFGKALIDVMPWLAYNFKIVLALII